MSFSLILKLNVLNCNAVCKDLYPTLIEFEQNVTFKCGMNALFAVLLTLTI